MNRFFCEVNHRILNQPSNLKTIKRKLITTLEESTNQPAKQPTNQPTDQPTSQPIYLPNLLPLYISQLKLSQKMKVYCQFTLRSQPVTQAT